MTRQHPADPKQIWQSQKTEENKMSLEKVRTRARRLEVYRRRVGWTMLPICLGAVGGGLWKTINLDMQRLPDAGIQVASIGFVVFLAYLSIKLIRARTVPPDAGLKTSVAAYRAHLEWERTMFPRVLGAFVVLMLAVNTGLWMGSAFSTRDVLESLSGGALLGMLLYVAYRRNRGKLNREFRMLDSLEADDAPKL